MIGIRDYDWGFGINLGIEIRDWDWALGFGTGD